MSKDLVLWRPWWNNRQFPCNVCPRRSFVERAKNFVKIKILFKSYKPQAATSPFRRPIFQQQKNFFRKRFSSLPATATITWPDRWGPWWSLPKTLKLRRQRNQRRIWGKWTFRRVSWRVLRLQRMYRRTFSTKSFGVHRLTTKTDWKWRDWTFVWNLPKLFRV